MAMNTKPVFAGQPDVQRVAAITAANTSYDGTGTASLLFTAGADGAFIDRIIISPKGTNVVTVMRLFLVTGTDNSVAANNSLIDEKLLPATTATQTNELIRSYFGNVGGLRIDGGQKLYITLGTTVAAGFAVTAFCADLSVV